MIVFYQIICIFSHFFQNNCFNINVFLIGFPDCSSVGALTFVSMFGNPRNVRVILQFVPPYVILKMICAVFILLWQCTYWLHVHPWTYLFIVSKFLKHIFIAVCYFKKNEINVHFWGELGHITYIKWYTQQIYFIYRVR